MSLKETGIGILNGISTKRTALFKKIGVETVYDLITYFPKSYIDYTNPCRICETEIGEFFVISAEIKKKMKPIISSRVNIFKVIISDDESEIIAVFFNTPYSVDKLFVGEKYLFYGKIGGSELLKEIINPLFIKFDDENKLVPKYKLTKGLSHVMIANSLKLALPLYDSPELLPENILEEYGLISKKIAYNKIHFPSNNEEYNNAKKRLVFDELLTLQLGMAILKGRRREFSSCVMKPEGLDKFYNKLPFVPTDAQKRAVNQSILDMARTIPMNRLLQGDVGSGKTLVAAALCFFVYKNGFQSAVMAPTEILAKQHYKTFLSFLEPHGIKISLLTGGLSAKEKGIIKGELKLNSIDVIIGTQTLIQKDVEFKNLGFAVTDEQHRFGVNQRNLFISKGKHPHTLVMSATPIPRTLALIIYGDLDISILDEMPKGRIPIETYSVNSSYRERLYNFIIKHINLGRQAYIVCPMIEESENEKAGAVKYYNELKSGVFKEIRMGLLHGKMKQNEKDEVMSAFKENEISLLVSTTVIEVGVDVPNSVIMLIENSEQFGLSQLHQLRGRVGRGQEKSYCILITDNNSAYTKSRMETMVRTSDGFEIANEDLKLRGPGNFFGSRQHGLPELKIANMTEDSDLLDETKKIAVEIIKNDLRLEKPENFGYAEMAEELFGKEVLYGIN